MFDMYLDIRQQIKALLKILLDWSDFNKNDISVPLAEIDSDEVAQKCPVGKVFLNFFAKLIIKHLRGSLFLIKLQTFWQKETLARTFSCSFFSNS